MYVTLRSLRVSRKFTLPTNLLTRAHARISRLRQQEELQDLGPRRESPEQR